MAELAAYVDEKMRTAAESGAAVDTLRLAVLAALNIADELVKERSGRAVRAATPAPRELEEIAAGLIEQIDGALASHGTDGGDGGEPG